MKSQSPIRTLKPDFGGINARYGFAYQDHAAVQFCLMMLDTPSLKEVWCETYDDIVLLWETNGQEVIEFVQGIRTNSGEVGTASPCAQSAWHTERPLKCIEDIQTAESELKELNKEVVQATPSVNLDELGNIIQERMNQYLNKINEEDTPPVGSTISLRLF